MKLISKLLLILLGCSSCDPNTHEFGFEVYNQSDREIDVCLNMWYLGIQDILVPAYQDYDATSQYNILQRYDLTLKDMELLKHDIYYPPTPAMRNIKMWAPYSE